MSKQVLEITQKTQKRFFTGYDPSGQVTFLILKWFIKEGELIPNGPILEIESNKGAMEVMALKEEIGARVIKILALANDATEIETDLSRSSFKLAELETNDIGEQVNSEEVEMPEIRSFDKKEEKTESEVSSESVGLKIAPATRKEAQKLGVDISSVKPTGAGGIITEKDVRLRSERKSLPETIDDADVEYEVITPSLRWLATAKNMTDAWQMPHAGPAIDINPTPLFKLKKSLNLTFQKEHGFKLRLEHFFVMAVSRLLAEKQLGILNAFWHEDEGKKEIRIYKDVNVGIAIAVPAKNTRSGFSELVVSCVKKAQTLNFTDMACEIERLINDAVSGKPKLQDLKSATCVVNNTGAPVRESSEVIYAGSEIPFSIMAPGTAIMLSLGSVRKIGNENFMHMALRFDHRVCNGQEPTLFLRKLQDLIEHPERVFILR